MKTLIATLIVFLFCLPSMVLGEDKTANGQEAEDILRKGSIIDRNNDGTSYFYLVEFKGDVWWCMFTIDRSGATKKYYRCVS